MYKYLIICIFFNSCLVSSIHRPGVQINNKGILKNSKDSLAIVQFISFSGSFENDVEWRRFNLKYEVEKKDSSKLRNFLHEYLNDKKVDFNFIHTDIGSFVLLDKAINFIKKGNEVLPDSINDFVRSLTHKKLLVINFNFNVDQHLGYSTLGPAGETYKNFEITSHALLIENNKILYHRSNFASLTFVEDFFYKRAISRVLDDAFKK